MQDLGTLACTHTKQPDHMKNLPGFSSQKFQDEMQKEIEFKTSYKTTMLNIFYTEINSRLSN